MAPEEPGDSTDGPALGESSPARPVAVRSVSPNRGDEPDRQSRYRYRPMGQAYQGALEAVFSVVVATGAGYWADGAFGTSPWCLVAGATIGFAAFVLRLYRLGTSLDQASADEASAAPESPEDVIQPEEPCERPARYPGRADRGGDRRGGPGNGAK